MSSSKKTSRDEQPTIFYTNSPSDTSRRRNGHRQLRKDRAEERGESKRYRIRWSLKFMSININCMSSNLWKFLTQLAKSKYNVICIQGNKITDREAAWNAQYVQYSKKDDAAYMNLATNKWSRVIEMLLSVDAASLTKQKQFQEQDRTQKMIGLTGKMNGCHAFPNQSTRRFSIMNVLDS